MRLSSFFPALATSVLCGLLAAGGSAAAQADPGAAPATRFDRFISHFDFAASAIGELDRSATGPVQNSTSTTNGTLTIRPTHALGVMGTLRGQKSPWIGGELNYRWTKYTQNFTFAENTALNFYTQNTANEYTAGYIARPAHTLAGFQPFLGGGAGTIEFKPSRATGTGLPVQARAAYYYTLGGDRPLVGEKFGLRLGFRQVFFLAPDFGQNYLFINKRTSSPEPTVGFFVHF